MKCKDYTDLIASLRSAKRSPGTWDFDTRLNKEGYSSTEEFNIFEFPSHPCMKFRKLRYKMSGPQVWIIKLEGHLNQKLRCEGDAGTMYI